MNLLCKKYFWFLLGVVIIAWVVFVNRFPEGFVIAGEDTAQMIHASENFIKNLYDWQGRASLFYGIFYALDRAGISDTAQLSWYLGIFLFGAYGSFWACMSLVFRDTNRFIRFLVSIFYTLNFYTLYIFTYTWGYSYFQILYVFIPILVGLFIRFFETQKLKYGVYFTFALFFASPGFGNPAFALALGIFLALLFLGLIVFRAVKLDREMGIKMVAVAALSLAVSAYWILPILPQMYAGIEGLYTTNILDLGAWIRHTSNPIIDTVRLLQFNGESFFPQNFPYKDISYLKDISVVLTFVLPIVLILSIFAKKEKRTKRVYATFLFLFVVFILLVARVRFPFEGINSFLFQLPGMNTLRGYEKFAIFTPFIFSVMVYIFLVSVRAKKYFKVYVALCVLIIFSPLPFYVGKLQQNMSFIFAHDAKNYQEARYSSLVKIPEEYYAIRERINGDAEESKVAILPYSVIASPGWANYPAWKLQGTDITRQLYNKSIIDSNSAYAEQWYFSRDFNESLHDPVWIVKLLGMLNVKYILYHRDVDEMFIRDSQYKMNYLERAGALRLLEKNEYFCLYEVGSEFRFPYVGVLSENRDISMNPENVDVLFDRLKNDIKTVQYRRITPKHIIVQTPRDSQRKFLILNEPFNANWRAIYKDGEKSVRLEHVQAMVSENAWVLPDNAEGGIIEIEYVPMRMLYRGAWISGITLVVMFVYIVYKKSSMFRKFILRLRI